MPLDASSNTEGSSGSSETDGDLLRSMIDGGQLRSLYQPVVDLVTGETVGYEALARGIETRAHADRARQLGATLGQGYLYGRPAPLPAEPASSGTRDQSSANSSRTSLAFVHDFDQSVSRPD